MSSERQAFNDGFDEGFDRAKDRIVALEAENAELKAQLEVMERALDCIRTLSREEYARTEAKRALVPQREER